MKTSFHIPHFALAESGEPEMERGPAPARTTRINPESPPERYLKANPLLLSCLSEDNLQPTLK